MSLDLKRKFHLLIHRQQIEDIIYRSELMVDSSKIDVSLVLTEYANRFAAKKKFISDELKTITKRIRRHEPKYSVYTDYVDHTTLNLINAAIAKGLSSTVMIRLYTPMRKLILKNEKRIRSALKIPLAMMIVMIFMLGGIIGEFKKTAGSIDYSFLSLFIMDNFYVINVSVLITISVLLIYYPRRVPVVSKVYKKLDALLSVTLVHALMEVGTPGKEIIPVIRRQFGLPQQKRASNVDELGSLDDLVLLMEKNKHLDEYEGADLSMSLHYGKFNETFIEIKEKKTEEVVMVGEMSTDIIKNFSIFLMAFPLFQFILVMMDMVSAASSMATR